MCRLILTNLPPLRAVKGLGRKSSFTAPATLLFENRFTTSLIWISKARLTGRNPMNTGADTFISMRDISISKARINSVRGLLIMR